MAPTAEKAKSKEPASSPEVSLSSETRDRATRSAKPQNGDGNATSVREAGAQIAAAMLEAADPRTGEHSDDVELVVAELCRKLAVNGEARETILVAARLHDVGKVAIPREVLDKKGPLNKSEWKLIKKHTVTGERIMRSVPELEPASVLVRHSHEHFDGSGYPDGLKGEEIPLGSRIILCADAFHAIRSNRPYRKGRKTGPAMKEMKRCAGTQFDPEIVKALDASIRGAKRGRRRKLPPRLAVLFAVVAIGGGGAYAAERGWIPSPIPGLGPERGAETDATGPDGELSSAETDTAGAASDTEASGDDVAGTDSASGDTRGSTEGASADGVADRRGGDRGEASSSGTVGSGPGGSADAGGGGEGTSGGPGAGDGGGAGSAGPAPESGATGGGSTGGGATGGGSVGTSPGSSGSAPGQTGSTPGQSGSAPGLSGNNPGGGGLPPGLSGSAPGLSGSTPGQSGVAPGLGGSAPGLSGGAPGNSGNAPGQGGSGGNPHG